MASELQQELDSDGTDSIPAANSCRRGNRCTRCTIEGACVSDDEKQTGAGATKVVRAPGPVLTPETEPFWRSVRERQMELPRCQACGHFFFPPSGFCQFCWSPDIKWEPVAGTGRVFSFVTFQRLYNPAFADLLPYAVAVIELDEGPRLMSRITGVDVSKINCDDRVAVRYEELPDGNVLPLFAPAEP